LSVPWYWTWLLFWAPATLVLGVVVWRMRHRLDPWLLSGPPPLLALALFGIGIATMSLLNPTTGDEPHYLVMTQSLLLDGDFELQNNYEQMQFLEYHPETIPDPHVSIVGEHWYPVHGFGLPVLAAPWFAVAGRAGVVVMLALVGVAAIRLLWSVLRLAGFSAHAGGIATVTAALTLPVAAMAGQVFPEVPALLLVVLGLWAVLPSGNDAKRVATVTLAVAVLPWLHPKYLALGAALILSDIVLHRSRAVIPRVATAAVALLGSGLLLAMVSYWFYGVPLPGAALMMPSAPFGNDWLDPISGHFLVRPYIGLAGVLFDQQTGVFFASPVLALSIPGWILIWRRSRALAVAALMVFLSVYLPAGAFGVWFAGFSSPARFFVPVVPVLAMGIAAVLDDAGQRGRLAYAVLAIPSFVHAYLITTLPGFVRYGDAGTNHNYFIALAERLTRLDLTPLFPSFRNASDLTWITLLMYVAALIALTAHLLRTNGRPHREALR
jgi:hypothetical protein